MNGQMETMIITGGAGFIGANFVRHALRQTGEKLVIVDKLSYAGNLCTISELLDDRRVVFVQADIADREAMNGVFREHQPSAIVNFAAETHVDRSIDDPRPFIDTNIVGTAVMLETARQFSAALDENRRRGFRFLHVSTDEVYGTLGATGLFSEETPYAPNSPYAASKASADLLVRAYHETYRLPAIVTNTSNNYGPFQFPEKLIPLITLNAAEGKSLPIYGDGGNVRDWLYVEDHCAGILMALQRGRVGEKYNIGGAGEFNNLQVVDSICNALEELIPAAQNAALAAHGIRSYLDLKTFVADRPGHDRRYAIDATKIRRELGWAPAHKFETAIKDTVRWYIENRRWCEEVQTNKYRRERLGLSQ
jgi:dTDP-glucose 4,6-dehydratase